MSAEILLQHFDRISEDPDAIPCLRQFVLDLAVRGKLVEQDPREETASVLLKRIQIERAKRVQTRNIRESRLEPVPAANRWFDVPASWSWVRLSEVAQVIMGQSPPGDTYNKSADGMPLINGPVEFTSGPFGKTITNQYTTAPTNICEEGDLLLCVRGSTTGRTNIASFRACIGRGVAAIRPSLGDRYIHLYVWRMRKSILAMGRGIAFPSISRQQISDLPIPFPPVAEQDRIVARVDELISLCDQFEEAQKERERRRDRLTTAAHHQLNNGTDGEELRKNATFSINHLPRMTARAEQIEQLRHTIRNLAVRGRLSTQEANEEPASALIKQIEATRARLYAEKKIAKPKALPSVSDGDVPFSVAPGWEWTTLGRLCYQISDGPHYSPTYVSREVGIPFLSTRNVRPDRFDLSDVKYVSKADHERFCQRIRPERGDIIYTKGGTTGIARVNDLDFEFSVWVHLAVLRVAKDVVDPYYVALALNSPLCYQQSQLYTQGTSNFDLGLTRMIKILLPLPPLAEQHRIVAKVDELMTVCGRLEEQLGDIKRQRSELLEAVLQASLSPTSLLVESSGSAQVVSANC